MILIDAVCEAEYHRPDRGDTIASFLTRHAPNWPSWLKIVCTVRTQLFECVKQLPYTRITLDKCTTSSNSSHVAKDLTGYCNYRIAESTAVQTNITAASIGSGKETTTSGASQSRFVSHLINLARGNFLFAKLTLDLIESGNLIPKSANYKVCAYHSLLYSKLKYTRNNSNLLPFHCRFYQYH